MKWLIGVFAALIFTQAQAADLFISVKAKPGQTCAFFRGSFNQDNIVSIQNKWKPWIACSLTEGVGAECWLKGHGMNISDPAKFAGNFIWRGGKFIVEAQSINDEVFNLRLLCSDEGTGCDLLHFWNATAGIGYGCDMAPYTPPKPEPKAPSLLRKDAPAYKAQKSDPLSF